MCIYQKYYYALSTYFLMKNHSLSGCTAIAETEYRGSPRNT